jgi:hypothetical protein
MVLKPEAGTEGKVRLLVMASKKLPDTKTHSHYWAFVDHVADNVDVCSEWRDGRGEERRGGVRREERGGERRKRREEKRGERRRGEARTENRINRGETLFHRNTNARREARRGRIK